MNKKIARIVMVILFALLLTGMMLFLSFSPAFADSYFVAGFGKTTYHPTRTGVNGTSNGSWKQEGWAYMEDRESTNFSIGIGKKFYPWLSGEVTYSRFGDYGIFSGYGPDDRYYRPDDNGTHCEGKCPETTYVRGRGRADAISISIIPEAGNSNYGVFARLGVSHYRAVWDVYHTRGGLDGFDPHARSLIHWGAPTTKGYSVLYGFGFRINNVVIERQFIPGIRASQQCCSAYEGVATTSISYRWGF